MITLVLLIVLTLALGQNIQVTTDGGVIEGYPATDGNYHTFHGIPYAAPRLGLDKFMPSIPPAPLSGVYHAYDSGIMCARPGPSGIIGVENCLMLNVFTKDVNTPKPVLVWLNGEESNSSTSEQYSFRRFVEEEEIVVVTLNYRLSIFGFLCLKIPGAPGNAGLKDIILGLQWIQRNIASFGGNPNNVALMGHGSAASIVELINLSPKSENLIHKAIALSGTAVAPWAVSYDPIGSALVLANAMDNTILTLDHIILHLSLSYNLNQISNLLNEFNYTNNTQLFAPCIEDVTSEDAVLTDAPINILKSGNYGHIPYIAGYVTREGTQRAKQALFDGWLEKMQDNFTHFLPVDLKIGDNEESIAQDIQQFYFSGSPINIHSIERYLHYHGDTMVVVPTIRGARERAATSAAAVRLLEFGYMGSLNSDWDFDHIPLNGVRHGGILNYIFDFDLRPEDANVTESIVKRISTFTYTGTPTPASYQDWPAITNGNINDTESVPYLYYGGTFENVTHQETTTTNPQGHVMTFWDTLYLEYYHAPSSANKLMGLLIIVLFSFILLKVF